MWCSYIVWYTFDGPLYYSGMVEWNGFNFKYQMKWNTFWMCFVFVCLHTRKCIALYVMNIWLWYIQIHFIVERRIWLYRFVLSFINYTIQAYDYVSRMPIELFNLYHRSGCCSYWFEQRTDYELHLRTDRIALIPNERIL